MATNEATKRKADLLAVGLYPTAKGYALRLNELRDQHLVNAYLKALNDEEPVEVTQPLAREIVRRGLRGAAINEIERREGGRRA